MALRNEMIPREDVAHIGEARAVADGAAPRLLRRVLPPNSFPRPLNFCGKKPLIFPHARILRRVERGNCLAEPGIYAPQNVLIIHKPSFF